MSHVCRPFRLLLVVLFLTSTLVAQTQTAPHQLRITILDPDSRPVAGARVDVSAAGASEILQAQTTSPTGAAEFALRPGNYSVRVLAPGFDQRSAAVAFPDSDSANITVKLSIAKAAETVVVTAAQTPLPLAETGTAESLLDSADLTAKQPTSLGEALRFLPGAVVADNGRRGGITSLFVRGGDSRYNKVIVDGVPVNDAGGTYDFGPVPTAAANRIEFVRGSESALYGSDAMTSVVEMFTATGSSRVPDLTFGADGGNFHSAHGFASVSGARGRFDYNLFGDQFNTEGASINDDYSNSLEGANLGALLRKRLAFRFHTRHSNSRTGVPGEWNFNGNPYLTPDIDQRVRNNQFLSSADLTYAASAHWQHRLSGFEYNRKRFNIDSISDRDCFTFGIDCPFVNRDHFNRAGVDYQGQYSPASWAQSVFGYEFEDENGFMNENFTGDPSDSGTLSHGLRRNHALYGQQFFSYKRVSFVGGVRYVNNESFGEKVVPHAALTFLALRGSELFSGTRFRFAYGGGIKEPSFVENFGTAPFIIGNPHLKPEQNRSLEAGVEQSFDGGKYQLSADYFNNLFSSQIEFSPISAFVGHFINVNRSLAHGSEVEFTAHLLNRLSISSSYVYTSTQILLSNTCDPIFSPLTCPGRPLIRRPRHSGSLLATYASNAWGGTFGSTLLGRRPDSDFTFGAVPPQNHTAGYARFDVGGWRRINRYITAYANIENLLNKHYEDVSGFPGLGINFRAGMRFHIGGE